MAIAKNIIESTTIDKLRSSYYSNPTIFRDVDIRDDFFFLGDLNRFNRAYTREFKLRIKEFIINNRLVDLEQVDLGSIDTIIN